MKKKVLMHRSKEIDTTSGTDILDTYRDPYLNKKEYKEKLFQSIQSANGLKAPAGAKRVGGA